MRESFKAAGLGDAADPAAAQAAALGVLSMVIWTVLIIVTFKYVVLVMRADNDGEGGIIALISQALRGMADGRVHTGLLLLGVFGASLFYGDGIITPAISVLSAIEGLDVATPFFHPYIVPITLVILVLLFAVQSRGSDFIGRFFGPVMVTWFLVLGLAGLWAVLHRPGVLLAVDPRHALGFGLHAPGRAFVTLGSVFLAVTGAEALYADMGHFSRGSIRLDWFALVLPALVLNYAGQAALVMGDPTALDNPFFKLVPAWGLYPLVILSAAATVIASQAVISGAFSLTQQAMQLGACCRGWTAADLGGIGGQVYVPQVNWMLMVAVVGLVLSFRSSDALAAAYGIAVTGTMLVTTVLLAVVMRRVWRWNIGLVGRDGGLPAAGGPDVLRRQRAQDTAGRVAAAGGGRCDLHPDDDLAHGPQAGAGPHGRRQRGLGAVPAQGDGERPGAGARHGGLPDLAPGPGAVRAGREPEAQPRPARAGGDPDGRQRPAPPCGRERGGRRGTRSARERRASN